MPIYVFVPLSPLSPLSLSLSLSSPFDLLFYALLALHVLSTTNGLFNPRAKYGVVAQHNADILW
jgi:hypothetical protein